jgi:hypothetical protein
MPSFATKATRSSLSLSFLFMLFRVAQTAPTSLNILSWSVNPLRLPLNLVSLVEYPKALSSSPRRSEQSGQCHEKVTFFSHQPGIQSDSSTLDLSPSSSYSMCPCWPKPIDISSDTLEATFQHKEQRE